MACVATPDFILEIRELVGDHPLWLPGVTAVITRDEGAEVLMVRRADNGAWTPVTGIIDPGEEPAVAAAREALEETGVMIEVHRLVSTSAMPEMTYDNGDRAAYLDLTFACTWLSGEAHVADDESTDVRWWRRDALPPMSAIMRQRIDDALAGEAQARFVGKSDPQQRASTGVEPLRPESPVLGVDACRAGWVGVLLGPKGRATVHVAATVAELVSQVRETADPVVVAIDIPIGLPDASGRRADSEARAQLPGKSSSVFSTLTRSAYQALTYEQARATNLAATGGKRSGSAQAYALREKILQVDAWLRSGPTAEVIEVHPELSFARMAGRPVQSRKKEANGARDRREALQAHGITAPPWFQGSPFAEDDLLDACAALWTAARHAAGGSETLPAVPEVFSDGLAAAIRV